MKTIVLFFVCSAVSAFAADACCQKKPEPKKPACCAEVPAAAFSKTSLYQADAIFTDDRGASVTLGELRGRPVVLAMFFANCGFACPLTVTHMQAIRAKVPAELRAETRFVLVSFDTVRDTTAVLARYREMRALDEAWVVLRGEDDAVRELAALLGVKYQREANGDFAHSNLITVLNREGEIVHQRVGLEDGLDAAAAALTATAGQ